MIDDAEDDFAIVEPPADNLIPFPRMRANRKLADAWRDKVEARNKKNGTSYKFRPFGDAVDELVQMRGMPCLPWPADWVDTIRRCRAYPGDMIGVVGSQGGGKTGWVTQACLGAAGVGTPSLWAPLELDEPQLLTRSIGSIHGEHAFKIRDTWSREAIDHAAAAFTDLMHFVDRYRDPDKQLQAMRDAVSIAWEIYGVPPILVVDHVGKLFSSSRDPRVGAIQALEALRELTVELKCYTIAISQGSRGNQAVLTGKVDVESAPDAIGVAAETRTFEEDCAYVVAFSVFKEDDVDELDAHALWTKCRHTGKEGRTGWRFIKKGARWRELDSLPATPSQVAAAVVADKKDKHRTAPPRSNAQARADINASKAGDAAAMRRVKMLEAVTRYGHLGIEINELRKVHGVGRGALFHVALQELERAGSVERNGSRVRVITRME